MSWKDVDIGWSPSRVLVIGFACLALLGGVLLSLPVATQNGQGLPFLDALFTATSALCVTGLVVDTGSYFSHFGQIVILLLIQIGGLGFMTVATFIMILSGKRIGLRERLVIQEALNVNTLEGLVRLSRNIVLITIGIELFFAAILALRFSFQMPLYRALYFGLFHAVSAFNNAGFDLFGGFRSLTGYVGDPVVNLAIMLSIIFGGIGFTVMVDLWVNKRHPRRLSLHTKLVLLTSGILLAVGAAGYLAFEWNNPKTLGSLPLGTKLWASFFASTTARTAGYATINYGDITDTSKFWTVLLMFIGASPGSTGGGIKTVTAATILLYIRAVITGRPHTVIFRRRVAVQTIYKALAITLIASLLVIAVTMLLTLTEHKDFLRLLFETTSAFGTVGLSTNLTPELSRPGRAIITVMMFVGRVGPLTLAVALAERNKAKKTAIKYPEGKLFVG